MTPGPGSTARPADRVPRYALVSMVKEGKPAPEFTLTSDSGEEVSLESLRGKPVVLYFYPKDDSPARI